MDGGEHQGHCHSPAGVIAEGRLQRVGGVCLRVLPQAAAVLAGELELGIGGLLTWIQG